MIKIIDFFVHTPAKGIKSGCLFINRQITNLFENTLIDKDFFDNLLNRR